jgi:hypothetical protein
MTHPSLRIIAAIIAIAPMLSLPLGAQSKHKVQKRGTPAAQPVAPLSVVEIGIPQMRAAMDSGQITSHGLVVQYLTRIALFEDKLHAIITVNPHVLAEADERDHERAQGHMRGPLHGIPIALKDNILTHDIVTTGGALAFDGFLPPYDATLVKNLRDAGAVIVAKTTLSELANWVAGSPTPMPANYNAVRIRLQPLRSAPRSTRGYGRWATRYRPEDPVPAQEPHRISGSLTSAAKPRVPS